ncbi:MAG: hypothetical protein FWC32_01930 [Firmicutes bacterium]|nr:hypothetical protein [Bacillota bacterium]
MNNTIHLNDMIKNKLVIFPIVLLMIFTGCGRRAEDLTYNNLSEYLPFTLRDELRLTFEFYETFEKSYFTEEELMSIYGILRSFEVLEDGAPWGEGDFTKIPVGQPIILQATSDMHTVTIAFVPGGTYGSFATVQIDDGSVQWFRVVDGASAKLVELFS